jgi:Family of unknown function (DUF6600)/FecR protein
MRRQRSLLPAVLILPLVLSFAPSARSKANTTAQQPPSAGLSHVRVVRLSFVEGTVTVRRPGSAEWAKAGVNTPIEQGFSVATTKKSFVEIQFENGSTVRLGELSSVEFNELALTARGDHINHLTLDGGYATFHIVPQHHDEYLLNVSGVNLTPHGKTEFRTDLNQDRLRVEVFRGKVQATDSNQTQKLGKNHTLTRNLDSSPLFQVTNTVQMDEWDKWAAARDQQSTLAYNNEAVGLNAALYGWDDLEAYGDWGYFPGFGYGWAPYEPLGWSPYSLGMWSWYPGWGYTWISGEPWGWLPFHYGFWNFSPSIGWFWMPSSFAVWNPALVNWYAGPGWVGWAPVGPGGLGGQAPCSLAVAGCLTAVPPGVLRTGEPIKPHVIHPGATGPITAILHPDVAPDRSAMLSGQPVPGRINFPNSFRAGRIGHIEAVPNAEVSSPAFARGREAAPSSVVMGRQVSPDAFLGRHSFLGGAFGSGKQPIRVRLGGTMGGQFSMATGAGRAGGPVMAGSRSRGLASGPAVARPQILSRRSFGGSPAAAGGFGARGGSGSSPGMVRSGGPSAGGGFHGGAASAGGGFHGGGGTGGFHGGGGGGRGGHR